MSGYINTWSYAMEKTNGNVEAWFYYNKKNTLRKSIVTCLFFRRL